MMESHRIVPSLLWTLFLVLVILTAHVSTTVNIARGKPSPAGLTCGWNGPEVYYNHSQKYVDPSERAQSVCSTTSTHPPSAMVDGTVATWWQTTSRQSLLNKGYGQQGRALSNITLDLLLVYEVESITLKMQDSARPGTIIFYKSTDGNAYVPWVYRVTVPTDCNFKFSLPPRATPVSLSSAVCQPYTTGAAPKNEVILQDFKSVSARLKEWKKTRYIKIEFFDMQQTFNLLGDTFQHFTVSELEVQAECVCSDLSTACILSNSTGQYECICDGNTMGKYCDKCQPFYNQFPFATGKSCEACNCFSHSTECFYNDATAKTNMSLDASGVRRGGGVCQKCQHSTAGVNCEKCIDKYYRPAGVSQSSPSVCVPCSCSAAGVQINPATNLLGDCVVNNDTAVPPGKAPGDCFCKQNVAGSKCDKCKLGYYNLQASNPNGCDSCYCNINGTVAGSFSCESSGLAGQCPCKKHVINRQCSQCVDEYFGLSANNTDGCSPCTCDKGGSLNNNCNKEAGQCSCRPNVAGRTCNEAAFNYYLAGLHFLSEEFKPIAGVPATNVTGFKGLGYLNVAQNGQVEVKITIPSRTQLSNNFFLLLRYNAAQASKVTVMTKSVVNPFGQYNEDLAACASWCYHQVGKAQSAKPRFQAGEQITVGVTVTAAAGINLDEVVLVPVEFTDASAFLGADNAAFVSNCDAMTNTIKDTALGDKQMRSVGTYYLNGAQRCDCNPLGSYTNVSCEMFTGQCSCKPGVTGRRCDTCKLQFYGLTAEGCKSCECKSPNKVCNQITGACECPPNVQGRICDTCALHSFNYDPVKGCTTCSCDVKGSIYLQCNVTTGACTCKPGVTGVKCDTCTDGFAKFNVFGCAACNCDPAGSLNTVCNKTTGQCDCKSKAQGLTCNQCAAGAFHLQSHHRDGCLDCVCMGVTKTCTSTSYQINNRNVAVYDSAGNGTITFALATEKNSLNKAIEKISVNNLLMLQTSQDAGATGVYWTATANETLLKGNLVGSYGLVLSWTIHYISADSSGTPIKDNKVIVLGRNSSRFAFPIPEVKLDNSTNLSVHLRIEDLEGNATATRGPFLLGLSEVNMILIPALYNSAQHVVRFSNVSLQKADASTVGGRAWPVEQCACGLGYSGTSCESCAAGYHRNGTAIDGYLSHCVGCECYKHADTCDSNTGACLNCRDRTTGHNCENCENGYYGNPKVGTSQDCQPCPCFAPRVANSTCALVNGSVKCSFCNPGYSGNLCDKCDKFYFGNPEVQGTGKCENCFCNGNSDTCDAKTGNCLNCAANSTGLKCEKCMDTFYGNASLQQCKACSCNMQGSSSSICNSTSGNCTCHPGVTNRICDSCLPNYFGFSDNTFLGCKGCGCNLFGSATQQCRDDGVCPCAPNVNPASNKCDRCSPGYFGLPTQACQTCACDPAGSTDTVCNLVSGQCPCKVGKAGRTCNVCDFMYELNNSTGQCVLCGDCPKIIGNVTRVLTKTALQYWNATQNVGLVQEQDVSVIDLQQQINQTMHDLGVSNQRLGVLETLSTGLTNNKTNIFDGFVSTLLTQGSNLEKQCQLLENRSRTELTRVEGFKNTGNESLKLAKQLQTDVGSLESLLRSQVATAAALVAQGNITSGSITLNLDADKDRAKKILTNITKTADEAQIYANTVQLQATGVGNLTQKVNAVGPQLDGLRNQLSSSTATLNALKIRANTSATLFNMTFTNKVFGEKVLQEASDLLNYTQHLVEKAQQDLVTAQNSVSETKKILHGPVQELSTSPLSKNEYSLKSIEDGVAKLQQQIGTAQTTLAALQTQVTSAGSFAQNLTTYSAGHLGAYQQVQNYGQQPVQSIRMLQGVITSIQSSQQLVIQANETISEAVAGLKGRTTAQIRLQAESFRNISIAQQQAVNNLTSLPTSLMKSITSSNETLLKANATWNNVSSELNSFLQRVNNFPEKVGEVQLIAQITEAERLVSSLQTDSNTAIVATNTQDPSIGAQEAKVGQVQTFITNATRLQSDLHLRVKEFKDTLTKGVGRTLNLTQDAQRETASLRSKLEANLALLEAKVALASKKLVQMELPIRVKQGSMQVVTYTPQASDFPAHQLVEMEFKYSSKPEGVLFYMQHNTSQQGMVVHMKDNALHFSVNNGEETTVVKSPVQLVAESWFKVGVSRDRMDVTLSVVKLSTGGAVSTTSRGQSTQKVNVALDNQVYLGKLPAPAPQFQVGSGVFDGCINRVLVNGLKLDLWSPMVQSTSEANFCPSAGIPPNYPRHIPGVTFSGLSYLVAQTPVGLDFSSKSKMSIKFRTLSPTAVLFTIQDADSSAYYGLFLQNGRMIFQYGTNNDLISLSSNNVYDDGDWYTVSVEHNATYAKLYVLPESYELTNKAPDDLQFRQTPPRGALALPSSISVGGLLPNAATFHGPTKIGFAGTIQNLKAVVNNSNTVSEIDLNKLRVISQKAVKYDLTFMLVKKGIGFNNNSYAELKNMPSSINTITFNFLTYYSTGIVLYAKHITSTTPWIYAALFNGNLYIMFNQGSGVVKQPLRTRGKFLSDGRNYTVSIDFSSYKPKLTVNGEEHVGSDAISPGMFISSGPVYLGSVPAASVNLPTYLPVLTSFIGGISNFAINSNLVDFYNPASITGSGYYLSGIAGPPTVIPAPPYAVTPAPPTTPAPECLASPSVIYADGVDFYGGTVDYLGASLRNAVQSNTQLFDGSFTVTLEFRTYAPNGILVFASDTATSNTQNYFCLFLRNGKLTFSMQTSLVNAGTKGITLKKTYNDGRWHSVTVLRINNFIALVVPAQRDYINSGLPSSVKTSLTINDKLYVGGAPNGITGFPFVAGSLDVAIGNVPWTGCIRNITVYVTETESVVFKLDPLVSPPGSRRCFNKTTPGIYLDRPNSYFQSLKSDGEKVFTIGNSFQFKIRFSTSEAKGIFMVAYVSSTNFILFDIYQERLRLVLINANRSPMEVSPTAGWNVKRLCDNKPHELMFSFTSTTAMFSIDDGVANAVPLPTQISANIYSEAPVYIGGIKDPNWLFPSQVKVDLNSSFNGCISLVSINNQDVQLFPKLEYRGVTSGCPAA